MRSDMGSVIAIDVGGSFFTSAIVSPDGDLVDGPSLAIDSNGSTAAVLQQYQDLLTRLFHLARQHNRKITGIGISHPGPFDFRNSCSYMTHKFKSIYGINLEREIRRRCDFAEEVQIRFLHDAHAFVLGEQWQGAGRDYRNVAGITIGTGLGFGCVINERILDDGNGRPYVSLFRKPYKKGILEDVVSRQGIIKSYLEIAKGSAENDLDVVDIAERAKTAKDQAAILTFELTAKTLAENILYLLDFLEIECLVLGGQISKSFALMQAQLVSGLKASQSLQKICVAKSIDTAALIGVARTLFELPN